LQKSFLKSAIKKVIKGKKGVVSAYTMALTLREIPYNKHILYTQSYMILHGRNIKSGCPDKNYSKSNEINISCSVDKNCIKRFENILT